MNLLNWKTTLFGFLALIPQILNPIIPLIPKPFDGLMLGIFGVLAFYFAKDKNVTGVT